MNRHKVELEIGLKLPSLFELYDIKVQETIVKYLKHMNAIERHAYTIGMSHLGSSFNILKSNGYNDWAATTKSSEVPAP